eukprot:TRINITY_DN26074_c0_g1_i1.p1 TRINITY_DN26074_c0_g1~~TRINITY_DN26074_c0_g1_i1.p1  ORF type:complete len:447 (-),score=67.62 TRINITY_DN26074_c0_g1_i1:48-1325(-)
MDAMLAMIFAVIALFLWGSWGNMVKLAQARFEVFFLDYTFGNLLVGICLLPWYAESLVHTASSAGLGGVAVLGSAVLAGAFYACATLLLVSAIDLSGMAMSIPIALGCEFLFGVPFLMLVEGPGSLGRIAFNAIGVAFVLVALGCDRLCHAWMEADDGDEDVASPACTRNRHRSSLCMVEGITPTKVQPDVVRRRSAPERGHFRGSTFAIDPEVRRASLGPPKTNELNVPFMSTSAAPVLELREFQEPRDRNNNSRPKSGLRLAAFAGLLFAIWPCLSDFSRNLSLVKVSDAPLSAQSFYVVFVVSAVLAALIVLPILCRKPLHAGPPIQLWKTYVELPIQSHCFGLLAGVAQGGGSLLTFIAANVLGTCTAMSIVRCSPVVAAMWGAFVWSELEDANGKAKAVFGLMITAYLCAVGCLGLASKL